MNMGQDRQMQMVGGNDGNQFRQFVGQNAGNLNGYNVVQNVRNQVAHNPRVQNQASSSGTQPDSTPVYDSDISAEATIKAKTINREGQLQALVDGKKVIITESTIRRDLQLEDAKGVDCLANAVIFRQLTLIGVVDEAVNEEIDDSLEMASTTATSLDAEQDRGNVSKTQSKATRNEPGSQRTSLGGGPRCQKSMRDTIVQNRSERVSKISNDLLLAGVNTPRNGDEVIVKDTKMLFDVVDDLRDPLEVGINKVDPLNPSPPASESKPEDAIEVENPIRHEDEAVPASQGTAAMEKLVEKLSNAEDKNKQVERDLYWTIARAHEFYQEMIHRGFMFKERPNEAINVPIKDEKSRSSEIMPPKSAPLTQATIRRMIKENVDAAIAAEHARQANVRNDASGSGPVRGQDATPAVRECTSAGFMKCNPTAFHGTEGVVDLLRWFENTESVFRISECVEGKKVKFAAATLQGPALIWWNAKIATIGLETVNQMPWTEMKQLMIAEFCPIEEVQRMKHEL
nr:hypothetical protein [Tanacetum cinerariifolium]